MHGKLSSMLVYPTFTVAAIQWKLIMHDSEKLVPPQVEHLEVFVQQKTTLYAASHVIEREIEEPKLSSIAERGGNWAGDAVICDGQENDCGYYVLKKAR
ncbi:hypothetical protein C2S53_014417 [Perilla frutescens var. hirtella]|uniref:Uncharacterized protein n=1 Tax=Perilla frutescens var. hirtella TaxID=608512 RepID=A0AAD4NZJ0_PERFH|nr:hypothetical protein C2S53_014417 [Perilla frutescens var. hirtella]